ncbi:response regulator [Rhizobium rhizogenes]|jgi:FixJ family two-component response regulator|uniref:Response regulator n=1 Tax=Rhizobium rhizogenes TaxID=359 RepID=A0AA94V8P3_RHIRH|nr:response regulator [Rhizobium rhizogenes]NSY61741.1 response regulator [Agrobacterium tumefaciens]TRA84140.1 response regulator [Rhizobium rhizogenes]UXT84413.1 response regulator [Agrobacterium tumefaciens]
MSNSKTIAVIDDDLAIREALDDLMASCGYESRLFSSAEDYLAAPDRENVDCMLLDVDMPGGLSGLDLQAILSNDQKPPPIIFVTSYHDGRTKAEAMERGAFAFLGKPVDVETLLAHVESALQL